MRPYINPRARRTRPSGRPLEPEEGQRAACLLYDRLVTLLPATTYQRMKTASLSPSEELPRHRHSARQRVDAAVLVLVELLPCRA
jgi:hypothetical protein